MMVEVCSNCGVVQDIHNTKCAVCKKKLYGFVRYNLDLGAQID